MNLLNPSFAESIKPEEDICVNFASEYNKTMKLNLKDSLLLLLLMYSSALFAQTPEFLIKGQVIEVQSGAPIEYATISVTDAASGDLLTGETTDEAGKFQLQVASKSIKVEVSFLGYESKQIENISFSDKVADLGVINLGEDVQTLDEVTVRAEKSSTEFKLDKRVFNVGKDLSSTGASALEVLNNVPSVNVNIEGEVSLRGSAGVQILIDGKPSVLTNEQGNALGSITAEMIEKVEVITNPSAKYEAEGTAGIINIVLKKNEKKGLNGSISVNTGIPANHNVGLSLNARSKKFNLFSQLGVGYRELPNDMKNINRDLVAGTELRSTGEEFRNENYYNFILGTDYYINERNVITLSGSFALELENQPSNFNFEFEDENGDITREWSRSEITEAINPKYQYELKYAKDFKDNKDHQLQFSAIGNFFGKEQSSIFENIVTLGADTFGDQETRTNFQEGKYTFNLDYTKPISKEWTMETGVQYLQNDVSNDFEVANVENGELVIDPGLTNIFEYSQKVLGLYGTTAYEGKVWGVKLGLRVENTDLSTLLVTTNVPNDQNFTNLFPSAHTSYKFNDRVSMQAGYSRRIYRPRLWDLNPFFNIRNNFSIRAGNPNLLPEYTDSYEIGAIFIQDKSSFNASIYHRATSAVIERISTFENNVNTTMPVNVGTQNSTGLEFNFKYSATKKLTFNGDANFFYFERKGAQGDLIFDFNASQWSTKITSKYKLNKKFEFEATGRYQSKEKTVQGERSEVVFADFGMRYKIWKGRGIINLSVRDIFASRVRESYAEQTNFYAYSRRLRGRFIALGFSYGFGKGEAMQFSGQRRR